MALHVGIDVDGIVADFNTAFMDLFVKLTGEDRFGTPRPDITCWNYSTEQFGYTKEQDRTVWQAIIRGDSFWRDLPPYKGTLEFLTTLSAMGVRVTFITSRVGQNVVGQTRDWLTANGYPYPEVIISSNKGDTCRRIGVTHYLDDKNENCTDVAGRGVSTWMLAHPYNQEQPGVPRITALGEFLDVIADLVQLETSNGR